MASSGSVAVGRAQSVANKRNMKACTVQVCNCGLSERICSEENTDGVPWETITAHMKQSGMHAGDLLMVTFRHHLARNAFWMRADFKWTLELNCHCMSLLIV
jgi:hypothetical protein